MCYNTEFGNCDVDEKTNRWGAGHCVSPYNCRGAQWCNALGICVGKSLCSATDCMHNEWTNTGGEGRCKKSTVKEDCRG